jgi:hypothetical protein
VSSGGRIVQLLQLMDWEAAFGKGLPRRGFERIGITLEPI